MSVKRLMPNQCFPLHFLYGPQDCCLCGARQDLAEFKRMAKNDIARLLKQLPDRPNTRKLMMERYGIRESDSKEG